MSIGKNIRARREAKNLSQVELATQVSISKSRLCQIERGTTSCPVELADDIATALGCSINDLLTDEN